MRTVEDTIKALPGSWIPSLPAPPYTGPLEDPRRRIGLAVESMRHHMTNEGWEIFKGLEESGYLLAGYNLVYYETNVADILKKRDPGVLVIQDPREWDLVRNDFREPNARFTQLEVLRERSDIFVGTILKDSHQRPEYHRDWVERMKANFIIHYYHPRVVQHLSGFPRPEHMIRTWHSVDRTLVPAYSSDRKGCLLSGAISGAYPLRSLLVRKRTMLPWTTYLPHPGYHRKGCCTPEFLKTLSRFKSAICTSSIYGYALRKIVEATACGCVVITDLPADEKLPLIDENLYRVKDMREVRTAIIEIEERYDAGRQEYLSKLAQDYYDYREVGSRLVKDIERMRVRYGRQ